MFKLKYPSSTSAPSLSTSTSAPSTPCRPTRSSTCALSVLQQQRQQHRNSPIPILTARARTTSLLPISPRRPLPPSQSSPNTARKKQKARAAAIEALTLGEDTTRDDSSMAEDIGLDPIPISSSHHSLMLADEEEERATVSASQNVVVCVRVRPGDESAKEEMWSMDETKNRITPTEYHPTLAKRSNSSSSPYKTSSSMMSSLQAANEKEKEGGEFYFDSLVLPSKTTSEMYNDNISPIIEAVVSGYNGTVFAYGQTGSGKTHTMSGTETEKGVIPRAVEEVFERVEKESHREFLLRVSYLEIYNETLKDLLAPYPSSSSCTDLTARPSSPIKGGSSHVAGGSSSDSSSLRIMEAGGRIQIQGLREEIVTNAGEVLNLLEWGQRGRHQAATDWNERSSRSHCVFILTLESREPNKEVNDVRFSQLNLIDLAGSERAASEKERRKEGAFINKSLLTLGTVIAKLSDQCQTGNEDSHIPYRDSKLTRLLQTSLGGNARVAVVCTLSPRKEHAIESMCTLRFGQRCKMVITKAKRGTIVNDKALIARYRKELERLRLQLDQGNTTMMDVTNVAIDDTSMKELQSRREKAEKDVKTMNEKRDELKKQVEHLTRLILTGKNVAADGQAEASNNSTSATRPRRLARRSDLGTSSPSKRQKLYDDYRGALVPLYDDQENSFNVSPVKPFAVESEMAALKKSLAAATAGRQASEDARVQETQLWRARIMELEAVNTEQEEELDEAEVAFEKIKSDRDALRLRVEEEAEANRLLQLVAKSRGAQADDAQKLLLEKSEKEMERLRGEIKAEEERQAKIKTLQEEQMKKLQQQLSSLQQTLIEEQGKEEKIQELQEEVRALQTSNGESTALLEEMNILRENLRKAVNEKEQVKKELTSANLERGQEDAERDFADLVKGESDSSRFAVMQKTLADQKTQLEERAKEVEGLQNELREVKQKARPLPVPSLPVSPLMTDNLRSLMEKQLKTSEDRCKALELQMSGLQKETEERRVEKAEYDRQATLVASLERQLLEASQLKAGPVKALGGRASMQRGGSMREFKRYSASNELPSSNTVTVEQAVKAEREEIERLNTVIASQRTIMSDLGASVATWKSRLRLQHDIITRLVEAGGGTTDKIAIPVEELSSSASSVSNLKRASTSSTSTLSGSPSLYYGAHTYNRPPTATGLGLGSTSPTKGVGWLATMPGVKPDPLPLPNSLLSSPSSRARRRKTIEHEIQELKGSPRIKSTTDRLLEPSRSCNTGRPLPVPGSPAKLRPTRDYYI